MADGRTDQHSSIPELGNTSLQRQMDYNEWFELVHGNNSGIADGRVDESRRHERGPGKFYDKRGNQARDRGGYGSGKDDNSSIPLLPEIKPGMEKRQVSKSNLHSGIGKGTAYLGRI